MRKNINDKVPNYATVPSISYFTSLTSKYYSKYPVFKHPQFSKSLRVIDPGFTPTRTMNMADCEVLEWKGLAMKKTTCKMLTTHWFTDLLARNLLLHTSHCPASHSVCSWCVESRCAEFSKARANCSLSSVSR